MYWHTTDMVNTAPMASGPAKDINPRSKDISARKMTACTGVFVYELMLYRMADNGSALSRENANSWREPAIS